MVAAEQDDTEALSLRLGPVDDGPDLKRIAVPLGDAALRDSAIRLVRRRVQLDAGDGRLIVTK